jgi:hypothetical protein
LKTEREKLIEALEKILAGAVFRDRGADLEARAVLAEVKGE